MASAYKHGWVSLPSEAEIHLEHGIPDRVWVPNAEAASISALFDEIQAETGLHVRLGAWFAGERPGEAEATVVVDPEDFGQVLNVLAHASAETFFDRYRKPIAADDVDFDEEAYAQDFGAALHFCGLRWGQMDQGWFQQRYLSALHHATEEIRRHPE